MVFPFSSEFDFNLLFLGVKGNAEKMLQEAGGKTMDSLSFQAMMSRKMGQVCYFLLIT